MDTEHPTRFHERLAQFICDRREQITKEWMTKVQADKEIETSETITSKELRDHLPQMFDDLVELLRSPHEPEQTKADRDARRHGQHRWQQGYRLGELLRELARVRSVLLDHVTAFEEHTPGFSGPIRHNVLKRIHWYFDELATASAEQFVAEQNFSLHTEVRQAKSERQEAVAGNIQLQETDAARLRLLRTVAHELRNSVNAAHLTAQTMLEEDSLEGCYELGRILSRNTAHMVALLNDLLDFSILLGGGSPRAVHFQALEPAEFCRELMDVHRPAAEAKGLDLEGDCDLSFHETTADRAKLRQIADNLISNAIKYTATGKVQVTFRRVDENHWSLSVKDSGSGIPPEAQERLFQELYRVPGTEGIQGTGLGLAITRRLVELLGGTIRLESKCGQGSRFEVILPYLSPERKNGRNRAV